MKRKPKKHVQPSSEQKAHLCAFMMKHSLDLQTTDRKLELWNQVVQDLNALKPKRDAIQWKKTWIDYKCNMRKRLLLTAVDDDELEIGNDEHIQESLSIEEPHTSEHSDEYDPNKCQQDGIDNDSGAEALLGPSLTEQVDHRVSQKTNANDESEGHSPEITDVEQDYLIHAYHATRLSLQLSHDEAMDSTVFWTRIRKKMTASGCSAADATVWKYTWQLMYSKLLEQIQKSRRRSGFTLQNQQLLAVVVDSLDEQQLESVERCLSMAGRDLREDDDDHDEELVLYASVFRFRDKTDNSHRFMMRCHRCSKSFDEPEEVLDHIRRLCDDDDNDEDEVSECSSVSGDEDDITSQDVRTSTTDPACMSASSDDEGDVEDSSILLDSAMNELVHNNIQTLTSSTKTPPPSLPDCPIEGGGDEDDSDTFSELFLQEDMTMESGNPNPEDEMKYLYLKKPMIKCTIEGCPVTVTTNKQLVHHTRSVHNRKPFQCTRCPRTLLSQGLLNLHLIEHENNFQCDICKRRYPNRSSIIRHMRMHDKSADFKCSDCHLWFRHEYQRQKHWHEVHGDGVKKPVVCEHCGMRFRYMSGLKDHISVHSGERPFKCDLCGALFRQYFNLATHIRRLHTKEQPFKCRHNGCEQKYRNFDTRLRHEVRVHGGSGAPPRKIMSFVKE